MNFKKPFSYLVLCSAMVVSLAGCSSGGDSGEMAPLSDKELLERGKAGREMQGSAQSAAPSTPNQSAPNAGGQAPTGQ